MAEYRSRDPVDRRAALRRDELMRPPAVPLGPCESGGRCSRARGRYKRSLVMGMLHGGESAFLGSQNLVGELNGGVRVRSIPGGPVQVNRGDGAEGDALQLVFLSVDLRQWTSGLQASSRAKLPALALPIVRLRLASSASASFSTRAASASTAATRKFHSGSFTASPWRSSSSPITPLVQ